MMKWLLIPLSLCLFVTFSHATTIGDSPEEEAFYEQLLDETMPPDQPLNEFRENPEFYLQEEHIVYDYDSSTGLRDNFTYTGYDKHRMLVGAHINHDLIKAADLLGLDLSYGLKLGSVWALFNFSIFKSRFDLVAENNNSGASGENTEAEGKYSRAGDVGTTIQQIALGAGKRFRLASDFFNSDSFFESINVYASYNIFQDELRKIDYSGYGLRADYELQHRTAAQFFYGVKLSYNWAIVQREKIDLEPHNERSLSLSWLSAGLFLGLFY